MQQIFVFVAYASQDFAKEDDLIGEVRCVIVDLNTTRKLSEAEMTDEEAASRADVFVSVKGELSKITLTLK